MQLDACVGQVQSEFYLFLASFYKWCLSCETEGCLWVDLIEELRKFSRLIMNGKRKYEDLIERDMQAVQNLLKLEPGSPVKFMRADSEVKEKHGQQNQNSHQSLTELLAAKREIQRSAGVGDSPECEAKVVTESDLRRVIAEFVDFYEKLDTTDIVNRKPNYSYTELIFLALMRSPNFCLPIHEIYRYIRSRFAYFRRYKKEQWKSAVRHSLSKTRCFTKIGDKNLKQRSGSLKRACYLWTIVPKSLSHFARGDYRAGMDLAARINVLRWAFKEVDALEFWNKCADAVSVVVESLRKDLEEGDYALEVFQKQVCVLPRGSHSESSLREEPQGPMISRSLRPALEVQQSSFHEMDQLNSSDHFAGASWYAPSSSGSPFPSETDSDVSYSSSPPDSGHETLGEISSPEELFRQFNYYQSQHCSAELQSPALTSTQWPIGHSSVTQSYLPLSEVAVDEVSLPLHPSPLQAPLNGEEESRPLAFSGILNGPDVLVNSLGFGCETFGNKDSICDYAESLGVNQSSLVYL